MGREERRRQDRKNRIEDRKGKLLVSREELSTIKQHISDSVSDYNVEALMTCFALTEHRLYGFDADTIFKTLQSIDDLMGAVLDGTATIEDYKKEIEETIGVIVKCKEE